MAKNQIKGEKPPCLRVKIGDAKGPAGRADGCLVAGTGSVTKAYKFDLRKNELKTTTKSVDFVDGKKCGVDKHGKPKACPKPCGSWTDKPKVNKKGELRDPRCPLQLAFDKGQPFLRFCRAKGKPGFQQPVNSAAEAMSAAKTACAHWAEHKSFDNYEPFKNAPLRGPAKKSKKR